MIKYPKRHNISQRIYYTQLLTRFHEVSLQKGGEMEEILQELREIKELLRIIASNTEQGKPNIDNLAEKISKIFIHLAEEYQ